MAATRTQAVPCIATLCLAVSPVCELSRCGYHAKVVVRLIQNAIQCSSCWGFFILFVCVSQIQQLDPFLSSSSPWVFFPGSFNCIISAASNRLWPLLTIKFKCSSKAHSIFSRLTSWTRFWEPVHSQISSHSLQAGAQSAGPPT